MQGASCAHHRYKSHAGAVFSFPYKLQVTLYNPSLSAMLSFRDQNTTQHTALLIFCPILQFLGDQWRRGQRKTSPLIPVNSHFLCDQDTMGEGSWVLSFTLPDSSRRGKWYSQLYRNRHLPMMTKSAWAFSTRANALTTYQMTQHLAWPDYFQVLDTRLSYFSSDRHTRLLLLLCVPTFSKQRLSKSKNTMLKMTI